MRTIIVTGSAELIGSEAVRRFAKQGARVVGIDNDMRTRFFGSEASTRKTRDDLIANVRDYELHDLDIQDVFAVTELFKSHLGNIGAIVNTASQPSHNWAARDPQTDFTVNANGTLNLLEAARNFSPERHLFLHPQIKFGMPTVSFRGGSLTGPAHAGAELHGFLSYLMICAVRN